MIKSIEHNNRYIIVTLHEEPFENVDQEKVTRYQDEPVPSFYDALDALKSIIKDIWEVPAQWVDTVSINKVSFKRGTTAIKARLFFTKELKKNGIINVSTNDIPFDHLSGEPLVEGISADQQQLLRVFLDETNKYIDGIRSQRLLPFHIEKAEAKPVGITEDIPFDDDGDLVTVLVGDTVDPSGLINKLVTCDNGDVFLVAGYSFRRSSQTCDEVWGYLIDNPKDTRRFRFDRIDDGETCEASTESLKRAIELAGGTVKARSSRKSMLAQFHAVVKSL